MKRVLLVLFIASCNNPVVKQDVKSTGAGKIVGFESEQVTVWVNDSNAVDKIIEAEIKFEPYISFADYIVDDKFAESRAALKLNQDNDFWSFRTRLRDGYKDSVNFAGNYCFVDWGCGSGCQQSAVIDARTGIIYKGPDASLGYDFKTDSRLLIVNPPSKSDEWAKSGHYFANCEYCHPLVYIWNEAAKTFEEKKSGYH